MKKRDRQAKKLWIKGLWYTVSIISTVFLIVHAMSEQESLPADIERVDALDGIMKSYEDMDKRAKDLNMWYSITVILWISSQTFISLFTS